VAALTVRDLVERVLAGHAALAAVGEGVADEWQYVADLGAVWSARLRDVAATRGTESVSSTTAAAVHRLVAETQAIDDPHRAIDWLSTLPAAALLALGEAP